MNKIFDLLFPMLANIKDNKKVRDELSPVDENGAKQEPEGVLCYVENSDEIGTETLKRQYENTIKTKEKLEDKAKSNVIGVTISITLIMGASNVLKVISEKYSIPFFSWLAFALFTVAVAYMIIGGILAVKVLINENHVYIIPLGKFGANETELRTAYDINTAQNIRKNLIRNNYIYTSYECIRNALVCLFFVLVLSALPLNFSTDDTTPANYRQTTGNYSFMYSPDAILCLDNQPVRSNVETAILNIIKDNATSTNSNTSIGIIDSENNLFIKFQVVEKNINVMLVEAYMVPEKSGSH